jgi:AraC family transcriptional regulator
MNSERILYTGAQTGLRIGAFRRYPSQPHFEDTGPIGGYLLVFPRVPVVIQHADKQPIVADPTRVMLYNVGQEYRRFALSDRGDECEWFSFPRELVEEVCGGLFTATHAGVDAQTYLLQRRISESADPLFVEEGMLLLLERCAGRPERPTRHRDLAEDCRAALAKRFTGPLSLFALARELSVSAFHLSRSFRAETKMTLGAYVHELRLRTALERVRDGEDLSRIATDLGYASHSHFTARFRRAFGLTPSCAKT